MIGDNIEEYNKDPVYYCKSCLSLCIKDVAVFKSIKFCGECGSTDIEQCTIEEWELLYEKKYGIKFLDKE